MSSAAATTVAAAADGSLQLDSVPVVDLSFLSQTELYALSLCSHSSFDPRRLNDVVIPKIDRSIFNESAGSRKQTYSRLRLAPAASSSANAAIRRRAPHIRAAFPSPDLSLSDPQNARIVTLLKQLFVEEETNNAELVPVRIDYSHSIPRLTANAGGAGSKRKRGRPRRNHNAVPLTQDNIGNDNFDGFSDNVVMNDIVIRENVEDRDKEILNRDGFAVDLGALGTMKGPFEEELWRRTGGLGSEEDLMEFLKGLDGQWGSRRKRKRIVEADDFGTVLPRGWKLILSVKKKEGRAWVRCGRYISPNGRQFESCKEVSSYLLSLLGVQDANRPNSVHGTESLKVNGELASAAITDHSVQQDDKREILMCDMSSPTVASISCNNEMQIMHGSGYLPNLPAGDNFHCEKCNITFNEKDELLHHHFSSHKGKRSKGGQSITDGVIIKEGKYECQFCHKTFSERHRYNGHIGAHVRNQGKSADESACVNVGEVGESELIGGVPQIESMMQASVLSNNNGAETTYLSQSNVQGVHDMKTDSDMETGKADVDVISTRSDLHFISEAVLSDDEKSDQRRTSAGTHTSCRINSKSNKNLDGQGKSSEGGSSYLLNNETYLVANNVIEVSASTEEQRQKVVFENSLLSSNSTAETRYTEMKDWQSTYAIDKLKVESDKLKENESAYGFYCSADGLKEKSMSENKLHNDSKDRSNMNINSVNNFAISSVAGCEEKGYSESTALSSFADEEARVQCNGESFLSCSQDKRKLDSLYFESNKSEKNFTGSDVDALASPKDGYIHSQLHASSVNSEAVVTGKYGNAISTCLEGPQAGNYTGNLLSPSGHQKFSVLEKGLKAEIEENGSNEVQHVRGSEMLLSSSSNQTTVTDDSLGGLNHDKHIEFHSRFPFASEKAFCTEDTATRTYCCLEESKQESSGNVFLMRRSSEANNKAFAGNKRYSVTMDEHEHTLNGHGCSRNDELRLGSSKPQTESGTNSIHFELERYPVGSSIASSGLDQTYAVQTNMNGVNHNMVEVPKEVQGFGLNLLDPAFNSKTYEFGDNFNMTYPAQVWGSSKVDVGNSENKFRFSLGSNGARPNADVMVGSIWGTNEENDLQGGLTSSTPLGQPSSCLSSYDILSDKGGANLFRVNRDYNCNTGYGLGSGRTEPVEYSFMTTQNSNAPAGQSKTFSYNSDMDHNFDTSFWLGKDALMPNVTGRNQVPAVCVWCGNEFHHEPLHSGTEGSTIGSMCPNCSARVQFNVS